MNSAATDRPNWWVRRGQQLAGGRVGAISWHSMSHLQKIDTTGVERKRTSRKLRKKGWWVSAACWLATDTCASKYLKRSPNAFWSYIISWWGEHKINHRPRWLPRGWLQHSLSCGNKTTAISGICGWWQLTNTAASCPVSLNFNFMLLQAMAAPDCLFLHHSLNPLLAICPLALVAFLSTILICLGSHFSTCTTLHYKMWL